MLLNVSKLQNLFENNLSLEVHVLFRISHSSLDEQLATVLKECTPKGLKASSLYKLVMFENWIQGYVQGKVMCENLI